MNNYRVIKSGNWDWNDHVGNFRGTVNEGLYFCQWKMVLWFIRGDRGFIYYQINR